MIDQIEFMKRRKEQVINGNTVSCYENIGSVKIFTKAETPPRLHLFTAIKVVEKFVPKIKQCYSCQRFGHVNTACGH